MKKILFLIAFSLLIIQNSFAGEKYQGKVIQYGIVGTQFVFRLDLGNNLKGGYYITQNSTPNYNALVAFLIKAKDDQLTVLLETTGATGWCSYKEAWYAYDSAILN